MTRTILTLLMLLLAPPAAHAQGILVKLCEKANALSKDKDGKDVKKEVNICLIHHEHLDEKGNVLVSAALPYRGSGQAALHGDGAAGQADQTRHARHDLSHGLVGERQNERRGQ
jgi:hypothetical protein